MSHCPNYRFRVPASRQHFVLVRRRSIEISSLSRGAFAVVHALRRGTAHQGTALSPTKIISDLEDAVGIGKGMRLLGALGSIWWAISARSRSPLPFEAHPDDLLSAQEARLLRLISVAISGSDPHLRAYLDYVLKGPDIGRIIGAARHAALILATAPEPWFEPDLYPASLEDL